MLKIKICGIRRYVDALYLNKHKPDYAGFILSEGFRRSIDFNDFLKLNDTLDKSIKRVGVFVNEKIENVKLYASILDVIQLHGNEDEKYIEQIKDFSNCEIWKAVRAKNYADIEVADRLPCDKLLIDSYVKGKVGGTGVAADFNIIKKAKISKEFFLAGGLNNNNINLAINDVSPYGVDLSSSVETDGYKDESKINEIITAVRGGFTNE